MEDDPTRKVVTSTLASAVSLQIAKITQTVHHLGLAEVPDSPQGHIQAQIEQHNPQKQPLCWQFGDMVTRN